MSVRTGTTAPANGSFLWASARLAATAQQLSGRPAATPADVALAPQLTLPAASVAVAMGSPAPGANAFEPRAVHRPVKVASAVPGDPMPVASLGPAPVPMPRVRLASLSPASAPTTTLDDAQLARTAVYDISARTVYMPNGDRLEAHSGLGPLMDNPRSMRVKMRGVTPPNTYRLKMRERLFHGVQAVRLLPEDETAMFRRDGMLAHSYMLGPNGQSNGCVSIKDYPRFLKAVQRGEVDRLVVVTKLDRAPRFDGSDTAVARAKAQDAAARQLAYNGDDSSKGPSDIASSFTSWLSRFTSQNSAAADR
jgi:hypothetical protein